MEAPSHLELAVLRAIAAQVPNHATFLNQQIDLARVAERENTGAGFFTTLSVEGAPLLEGLGSPVGFITAEVQGLAYGLGFLLWLRDGRLHKLEGYANGSEDTTGLDWENVAFDKLVAP